MKEKNTKKIQFLDKLAQYAKEVELSSRITDRIDECKIALQKGNAGEEINADIEAVLGSIRKKMAAEDVQTVGVERGISRQEIEAQVKKIAQRCHEENAASLSSIAERQNMIVSKCHMQMQEMIRTDAHVEDLTDRARYLQFYEKIAQGCEKEATQMLDEMFTDMQENYGHMQGHLKSMLKSADSTGKFWGGEKLFYELREQGESVSKKVKAGAGVFDEVKEKIMDFAKRTAVKVKQFVRVSEIKKKLLIALPVLLVALMLLLPTITDVLKNRTEAETAKTEGVTTEETKTGGTEPEETSLEQIKKIVDFIADNIDGAGSGRTSDGGTSNGETGKFNPIIILAGIAFLLVIIVLYIAYIYLIKKSCRRSMCKKCAAYLEKEFLSFQQSDCLKDVISQGVNHAAEEYEQQYLILLNNTFTFLQEPANDKQERLTGLLEEWNLMK